jgi:penicillin-binding protein 2
MANTVNPVYYAKIQSDKSNPQYNYATQQRSAPGSTFKMVSTVAALEEGILSTADTINCVGVFDRFAQVSRCWVYPGSHGPLYASQAIRHSCNYYFYEVGYRLSLDESSKYMAEIGLAKLEHYADMFGLTEKSGVEIVESTPQVSKELPVLSAIGQGTNSFTTVGLARYVSTIANNGTCYNLTLLDKLSDSNGKLLKEYDASVRNQVELSQSTWDAVHVGMKDAAASYALFNQLAVTAAGKTGTAQENVKRADHALFVGYAPFEKPEIAVSARICFGYSSGFASQVGYKVMEYYFAENKEDVVTEEAIAVDPNSVTNQH